MLRHKSIDRICGAVLALTLLLTCGFMGAASAGLIASDPSLGYENRLFDQSRLHTIDIVIDDWDAFLATCTSEEYSPCAVAIDGESAGTVGIRGKGNTSLTQVQSYGNDRYSFKIEFDQYQSGKTYHGLDKLSLNNLIQDKTLMKDYLAYTLMNRMGVAAPLCSFVRINVNGEYWGLYLAVEAVEDSFLQRNYGSDHGELYKPDSMSFGGGRGNGREFDMEAFSEQFGEMAGQFGLPENSELPENVDPSAIPAMGMNPGQMMNGGFDRERMPGTDESAAQESSERRSFQRGGMGSADVMLQYVDDDPSSYTNIFSNAKTDVTEADQQRLIAALQALSAGDIAAVDAEAVIRYLVVHNFLCNDDSYTGQMVHNYYLYEDDGVLSMIPWDYNLAFGGFSMGGGAGGSGATSTVNSPIDSPVSSGDISSRPMVAWIFAHEDCTSLYHQLYAQFIAESFDNGWIAEEIARVTDMIAPSVEEDPTAFFTYEEFLTATETLSRFCTLRAESISGQLDGTIPSTTEAQRANSADLVDASDLSLNDLGEFGMGGGGDFGGKGNVQGERMSRGFGREATDSAAETPAAGSIVPPETEEPADDVLTMPGEMPAMPGAGIPGESDPAMPGMPGGMGAQMPQNGGFAMPGMAPGQPMPEGGMTMPGTPPAGMNAPMAPMGEMPADSASIPTEASIVPPETAPASGETEEDVPADAPQLPEGFGASMPDQTSGENRILLAVSTIVLIAALLFAGFCKNNR